MRMLHSYCSFTIFLIIASFVAAIPLQTQQQQHSFELNRHHVPSTKKIPSSYMNSYKNLKELEAYYSKIVNTVVDSTLHEVIETAPETYLTIHELQFVGRDHCRVSLRTFMNVLEHQLEHKVKDNLLASIRPLIDNNPERSEIIKFNHFMSYQLGSILNAKQLSHNIIQKVYHFDHPQGNLIARIWRIVRDKKWALIVQHESNEAIALQAWLQSWLADIEYTLQDEFDANIHSLALSL